MAGFEVTSAALWLSLSQSRSAPADSYSADRGIWVEGSAMLLKE
jgi:hypothetical protein